MDVGLGLWSAACMVDVMVFFFFNDTATTEIYTLSLHDAFPIFLLILFFLLRLLHLLLFHLFFHTSPSC